MTQDITNGVIKVHLTQQGYNELQEELQLLKAKEPPAVERITKAREFGDLTENSEYHAAREDLALIQGRIDELEDLLARSKIISTTSKIGVVDLGCEVTVAHNGSHTTFIIVGEYEADPIKKKISHDSPLGKALLGRKVGEQVEFEAPVGSVTYTIKKIN